MHQISRQLRNDAIGKRIRVTEICPGRVETEIFGRNLGGMPEAMQEAWTLLRGLRVDHARATSPTPSSSPSTRRGHVNIGHHRDPAHLPGARRPRVRPPHRLGAPPCCGHRRSVSGRIRRRPAPRPPSACATCKAAGPRHPRPHRRRTRLRHPRPRQGRRGRGHRARADQVHAGQRHPGAARGDRRQAASARTGQALRRQRDRRRRRRQAGDLPRPDGDAWTPATRCIVPRPVLGVLPGHGRGARRRAGGGRVRARSDGFLLTADALEAAITDRHPVARPERARATRPAPLYTADELAEPSPRCCDAPAGAACCATRSTTRSSTPTGRPPSLLAVAPDLRRPGPARQRRLQDVRDDRVADRLGRSARPADRRDQHPAVAELVVPVVDQPGRGGRRADRRPGVRRRDASPPTASGAT